MTSLEEIRQELLEAEKEATKPQSLNHDIARKIVNVERQAFYGDESSNKRLAKIREIINETLHQGHEDEI